VGHKDCCGTGVFAELRKSNENSGESERGSGAVGVPAGWTKEFLRWLARRLRLRGSLSRVIRDCFAGLADWVGRCGRGESKDKNRAGLCGFPPFPKKGAARHDK